MSLEHAILGFLRHRPLSGYDLKARFDLSVQHFWPADQSQIYRTLVRLAERGWATVEVIEQEDRPDRKEYHITDAGQAELRRWLAAPLPGREARSASLIQLYFAAELSDDEVVALLRQQASNWRAMLARLQSLPETVSPELQGAGSRRPRYFGWLTLECGITTVRAHLTWLESVIARLERGEVPIE